MSSLTRRFALKLIGLGSACLGLERNAQAQDSAADTKTEATVNWHNTHDRVFLGGECWANPMENWVVADGAAECTSTGADRNVQLITHQLTDPKQSFVMSVVIDQVEVTKSDLGAGFKIGVRSELNEYRSNAFAKNGIKAGVVDGNLILGNQSKEFAWLRSPQGVMLTLQGEPFNETVKLSLTATKSGSEDVASVTVNVPAEAVLGNVAIVNNFVPTKPGQANGGGRKKNNANNGGGARYRFRDWTVSGDAFTVTPENRFGPLLWTMYSLSDSRGDDGFVMKLSALTGPMGQQDNKDVELLIQKEGEWKSLGTAPLHRDAWTATFRIANWDERVETPYKVVYRENHRSGSETESIWQGKIKANPTGRPLRLGALTCQNDYGFPYEPVAENLIKLDPDMLYFSGDQLYEGHGGFGIIRSPAEPAILNYLRKYYQHGWAFRHAMKNAPTICLPDDHDVFQGNIWGEGGKPMNVKDGGASSNGGYIEPARMVNTVHLTNCAHHPDFYDPKPVEQDISVYYGDMVYGDVSFAIIADRQWKSGPQNVETGSGRADHVKDQNVDTAFLDKPGLVLLGDRQEEFLRHWVDDWRGHKIKVLLSQTVFAGVATHHGAYNGYLKADLDSGGWPQTARNNAIDIIRKGMPLHINGDQHLTSLSQYGVRQQRDSCWSFCTPAISAGYPRWWRPDEMKMPHTNRPQHGLDNTGEYLDGFGNQVYVYAVGNPEVGTEKNRYDKAHQKGSGFGLVTIDTDAKTYHLDAFRFKIDATDGKTSNQFPGWPITIHQKENAGDNLIQ
ncbi:MAG: alkaline phosphatase D family protein [Pirellulaceae bacterium]